VIAVREPEPRFSFFHSRRFRSNLVATLRHTIT
jgi:hypothetical protein